MWIVFTAVRLYCPDYRETSHYETTRIVKCLLWKLKRSNYIVQNLEFKRSGKLITILKVREDN